MNTIRDNGALDNLLKLFKWQKNRPVRPDPVGEPEGEIDNPNEFDNHSSLVAVAKDGMNQLALHYPGHLWAIQINERGRMFNIFNHALHDQWGYTIRASEVVHQETRRAFIKAGGEILERFGLSRGRFKLHEYAALKKDPRGRCVPVHLSDLEIDAAKKEIRKRKIAEAIAAGRVADLNGQTIVGVK